MEFSERQLTDIGSICSLSRAGLDRRLLSLCAASPVPIGPIHRTCCKRAVEAARRRPSSECNIEKGPILLRPEAKPSFENCTQPRIDDVGLDAQPRRA